MRAFVVEGRDIIQSMFQIFQDYEILRIVRV